MNVVTYISEIRAAVDAMDPDRALTLFSRLEKRLPDGIELGGSAAEVQLALDEIIFITQATCDGIGSARQHIEKIISDASRVDVYDQTGEKISQNIGRNLTWKY